MNKKLCIYHKGCADGFAAAWVVWNKLGDIDFHAAAYGDQPPDVTNRDVVIVDFSYPVEKMRGMAAECSSMLVLDHHKTAQAALAEFPQLNPKSVLQELPKTKTNVLFDMERSGAGIAWDFFYGPKPRPLLIDMIEDRDLWRFKFAGSKAMHAFLISYPYDFDVWTNIIHQTADERENAIRAGGAIIRRQDRDIKLLIKDNAYRINIAGHDVPVLNCPYTWASDAGHAMCIGEPFAATYCDVPDPFDSIGFLRKFSLRSNGNTDVSGIAKQYQGGGGHAAAAGFTVNSDNPLVTYGIG